MSKSPLSGAFAESSATTKKKSKKNGAILLIAGIALTSSIGGVFAANSTIAINSGDALEFGQGIAEVDVCGASAETVLGQEYDATDNQFYVTTVDVTFPSSDCDGKDATVGLVSDTVVRATETAVVGTPTSTTVRFDFTGDDLEAAFVTDVTVVTAD
jgi:hypothetical protein